MSEYGLYLARTPAEIADLVARIQQSPRVGFDTESSGPKLVGKNMLNVHSSRLTGFSVGIGMEGWYIPVSHKVGRNTPMGHALRVLDLVYEKHCIYLFNAKHDILALAQAGEWLPEHGPVEDLLVQAYLCEVPMPRGLKVLAKRMLDVDMPTFEETCPSGQFEDLDPEEAYRYAALDSAVLTPLADKLATTMSERDLWPVFRNVDMPLVAVLARMEHAGMGIDYDKLRDIFSRVDAASRAARAKFEHLCVDPAASISSNSYKQYLFDIGVWDGSLVRKTPSGKFSTKADAMEVLSARPGLGGELASALLEYQAVDKIRSTYSESLIRLGEQHEDRRVHGEFNQTVARTGRLSSSDPNLQNIPVRTELGKEVREAFVPAPGHAFTSADYSQIELRVLAHFAGPGKLMDAYNADEDVHQQTADIVGCTRPQGKTCNFAFLYGAGPRKMAQTMGVSFAEAKGFMAKTRKLRKEVVAIQKRMVRAAQRRGYIKTPLGRRRTLDNINSQDRGLRGSDERRAGNTPVQGYAADICKLAMIRVDRRFRADLLGYEHHCRVVSVIHDEIVVEHLDNLEAQAYVTDVLKTEMENAVSLDVPLVVDVGHGHNLAELK